MKTKIIGLAVLTLLLASCNNDEKNNPGNQTPLLVEIGSRAPEISARAAIMEDNWGGTNGIGIYGLSKTADTWNLQTSSCLINNLEASISTTAGNSILFDASIYYPIDNEHAYTFYGYYPHSENVINGQNQIIHNFTITGTEDILWGKAEATEAQEQAAGTPGYNAMYIRQGGVKPSMVFNHLLTRFTFSVIDGNTNQQNTSSIKINYIKILNAINQTILVVADKNTPENEGKIMGSGAANAIFELKDQNGNAITPIIAGSEATTIGESIMVVPGEESYDLEIEIEITETGDTVQKTLAITHPQGAGNEFQAGVSHNVKLTVYGLAEVIVETSLTPWETGDEIELPDIN